MFTKNAREEGKKSDWESSPPSLLWRWYHSNFIIYTHTDVTMHIQWNELANLDGLYSPCALFHHLKIITTMLPHNFTLKIIRTMSPHNFKSSQPLLITLMNYCLKRFQLLDSITCLLFWYLFAHVTSFSFLQLTYCWHFKSCVLLMNLWATLKCITEGRCIYIIIIIITK